MKGAASDSNQSRAPLTTTREELLVDGSDKAFRSFVHSALAFAARLSAVREGFALQVGLSGPQYTILVSIRHLEDSAEIGVKEIAEHLNLSGTFVTTETRKLEVAGLVSKQRGKVDKRRVSLRTTPKADSLLERLSPIQRQVNDVHFGSLSRNEFATLCKVMPALVASTDAGLSLLKHLSTLKDYDSWMFGEAGR